MKLASRFANRSPSLRSSSPLTDDQIRAVAPSIFAVNKHASRSDRYTYIPTGEVLTALRKEGFEPFMVCQTRVRQDDRRDFTKHMVRMRHATQVNDAEANEIVLLNSHDGTSSYQLLAGLLRFVCSNGLVFGGTTADVRIQHKGQIVTAWLREPTRCSTVSTWCASVETTCVRSRWMPESRRSSPGLRWR